MAIRINEPATGNGIDNIKRKRIKQTLADAPPVVEHGLEVEK